MNTRVYVHIGPNIVRADYSGGPYIDLTFVGRAPTEVINVWDYEKGCPEIENSRIAVEAAVREWAAANEADGWTTWFEDYVNNANGRWLLGGTA